MDSNSKSDLPENCTLAIKEFVNAIRPTRYSTAGLEGGTLLEAEHQLNQSWPGFEALSEQGWSVVRKQLLRSDEMILWYYAVRMAELAVRKNDATLLRFGLMALIVDEKFSDQRDFMTALVLLHDAAKRISANVDSMFVQVAQFGSLTKRETIERYIDKWAGEPTLNHALEGVGYAASGSGESFTYRSII